MQNRHDGTDSHGWWEDLPPGVRRRFASAAPPPHEPAPPAAPPAGDPPGPRPGVVADLSRVAGLFVIVAVANLLFLLLALSFLFGGQPAH
jgi:hypothetical protein